MNHSIYSADRATLKVVVVALVAGIMVAGLGITARITGTGDNYTQTARVIKADKPVMVSTSERTAIR